MSPGSSNGSWIGLRIALFCIAIASALVVDEVPGVPRSSLLPVLAVVIGVYGVVTSIALNAVRNPTAMVGFSLLDVIVCGILALAVGQMQGGVVLCLYGFVGLAALGRNLLVGMSGAILGVVLYGTIVYLRLEKAPMPSQVALPGLVGASVFFVFGSVGLMVRRAGTVLTADRAKKLPETMTRDRALEDALTKAREMKRMKDQRELELFDKQRKLSALMAISRMMSSLRRPEDLLNVVVAKAREEVNSGLAFVMLLEGDDLKIVHSSGVSDITKRLMTERRGQGIFGDVVDQGVTVRLSEKDGDPRFAPLKASREIIRTILAVPMQAPQDKKPIGVLGVGNLLVGDAYTEEHEDFLRLLATDASIAIKNINLFEDLEASYYEIIHALAQAIEAKDPYTHGHVARVRDNAIRLAHALKQPEDDVQIIAKGAILHDVGKISTPNEILNKPGALTPNERRKMDDHVTSSIHILKDIRSLPPEVFEMVLFHHERFDGKGYPYGLKGDEIPIGAQIISVVDAFDAMTSDRPYRKGFPVEKAVDLLRQSSGTQFNPKVLNAFFAMLEADEMTLPLHAIQVNR